VARQMYSCGPRTPQKNDKSIKFDQIKLILRAFLVNFGPQKLFSYKLRPAEHFFSRMWPSDQFEFETPALDEKISKKIKTSEAKEIVDDCSKA
jgi:hypothetical protein